MSFFNDEQNQIEFAEVGDSFNDGKGELLPVMMKMYNTNFRMLVNFLSGGAGNLNLSLPIPVERGGLGSKTAKDGRTNLGLVIDPNNEIVLGNNSLEVFNSKFTIYGRVNNEHAFTHPATGTYVLTNFNRLGSLGYSVRIPKDDLGNPLIAAAVSFENSVMTLRTYAIKYSSGKAVADTTKPVDIPQDRFVLINAA